MSQRNMVVVVWIAVLLTLSFGSISAFAETDTLFASHKVWGSGGSQFPTFVSMGTIDDSVGLDFCLAKYQYLNYGYGTFYLADSVGYCRKLIDVNGDGWDDIVDVSVNTAVVRLNDSSNPGSFTTHATQTGNPLSLTGPVFFAGVGDVDSDGDIDVMRYYYDGGAMSLLTWDSANDSIVTDSTYVYRVHCAGSGLVGTFVDLDDDSDLDVVVLGGMVGLGNETDSNWVVTYHNDSTGFFTVVDTLELDSASIPSTSFGICSGSFDGDSYADVLVTTDNYNDSLIHYEADANGYLSYQSAQSAPMIGWMEVADLDDDGDDDIVGAAGDSVIVFYNDGAFPFPSTVIRAGGNLSGSSYLEVADADNDTDLDIIIGIAVGGACVCYNKHVADTLGDTDDDGDVDVTDMYAIIDYVGGGDPLTPWYIGDCNFDGATDSLDVNYVINYLFYNGPLPFVH